MLGHCFAAFVVWATLLVACNSLTAGPGSACSSAGGACVVSTPTTCVAEAPPSAQDCNTTAAPNPGGLACCLIFMDAGDAGDAASALDAEDAGDAEDAEDALDGDASDAPDVTQGADGNTVVDGGTFE